MVDGVRHYDAIVIGAGLSGLVAAGLLAEAGARVYLIAKGGGFLHFTSGCVDVWGDGTPNPRASVTRVSRELPNHPYARAGTESLEKGVAFFSHVMADAGYPFEGSLDRIRLMPTAIGSVRATCLTPATMSAGDLVDTAPTLIAGFTNYRDFYPPYLAANLRRQASINVTGAYLDLPHLHGRKHLLSTDLAHDFGNAQFREEVGRNVRRIRGGAERVGFPAVLGGERAQEVSTHLQTLIQSSVFEISTLPPSVPGIRLHTILRRSLTRRRVRVEIGFWTGGRIVGTRAESLVVRSAGHETTYTADCFVLATGGTGGGGIRAFPDGRLQETVFDLPVRGPNDRNAWARAEFLSADPQPYSEIGLGVDARLRPLDRSDRAIENVFVTASNLPGWDPVRERSGEGVALATGWRVAREALDLLGLRSESTPVTARAQS